MSAAPTPEELNAESRAAAQRLWDWALEAARAGRTFYSWEAAEATGLPKWRAHLILRAMEAEKLLSSRLTYTPGTRWLRRYYGAAEVR